MHLKARGPVGSELRLLDIVERLEGQVDRELPEPMHLAESSTHRNGPGIVILPQQQRQQQQFIRGRPAFPSSVRRTDQPGRRAATLLESVPVERRLSEVPPVVWLRTAQIRSEDSARLPSPSRTRETGDRPRRSAEGPSPSLQSVSRWTWIVPRLRAGRRIRALTFRRRQRSSSAGLAPSSGHLSGARVEMLGPRALQRHHPGWTAPRSIPFGHEAC